MIGDSPEGCQDGQSCLTPASGRKIPDTVSLSAAHQIVLGAPFGNDMVLQRDAPLPVWGWTTAGTEITIQFKGQTAATVAADNGKWQVTLAPLPADGVPATMLIGAAGQVVELHNVIVGEVWICSGQSNMAMELEHVLDASAHIAAAAHPMLRVLTVPVKAAGLAQEAIHPSVQWQVCSTKTAGHMSAVAYFFGRDLVLNLNVPVGLIVVATGSTPIELWVPREGLALSPELSDWAAEAAAVDAEYRSALKNHADSMVQWQTGGELGPPPPPPVHPYAGPYGQKLGEISRNRRRGLGAFFNGSVAPLARYPLRGMIWYQGESNRGDSSDYYFNLHQALVHGWRQAWSLPSKVTPWDEFPFYYVQISALESWRPGWQIPEIWDGQTRVMRLPNTGMAVIHDLCEDIKEIHPRNKEGVGQRLALWALAKTYGQAQLAHAGPMYKAHAVVNEGVRIWFDYAFGGLHTRDAKPPDWFTLASADGEHVPAHAQIAGDCIWVPRDQVPMPREVRFAWDGKAQPNLINGAGLPACPFRVNLKP